MSKLRPPFLGTVRTSALWPRAPLSAFIVAALIAGFLLAACGDGSEATIDAPELGSSESPSRSGQTPGGSSAEMLDANSEMHGTRVLGVRGVVVVDGGSSVVEFAPVSVYFVEEVPDPGPVGVFSLDLENASGELLASVPIQTSVSFVRGGEVGPPLRYPLGVTVADPGNVTRILVRQSGVEVGALTASANAPTVEVLFPNGGESLAGPTETIRWAASDADGDPLVFDVLYSPDGGLTWETLAGDHPGTELTVSVDALAASTQGLVRVIAKDGFHAVVDTSDGVTTPNTAPQVRIRAPLDGDQFSGLQLVFLDAAAVDVEDGALDAVSWSSDLDGVLGVGDHLEIRADLLTEGTHLLTATVTDAAGATAQDTVTIDVFRVPPPPDDDVG